MRLGGKIAVVGAVAGRPVRRKDCSRSPTPFWRRQRLEAAAVYREGDCGVRLVAFTARQALGGKMVDQLAKSMHHPTCDAYPT